jgi:glycosyltransferase involved in cell wall biosynthesis
MDNPFFSLIIPTYNRASLIGRTLQSVLDQTFRSFEIIVVDDGSSDDTESVVRSFHSDQIVYYKKENGERGASRNFGWSKANGYFVSFLDSDDIIYPNHFNEAYQFFQQKNTAVCYAQAYEIKNATTDEVIQHAYRFSQPTINNRIIAGNFLSCFGVFLRKDIFPEMSFEEDRRFAGTEDWLLWLRLAARHPFYYNNLITGALLEHEKRSVLSYKEEGLLQRTEMLKKKLIVDKVFVESFGKKQVDKIYAHMLSYTSLHLAMSREKRKACKYFLKSLMVNPGELLTKRSLSITKKILFS